MRWIPEGIGYELRNGYVGPYGSLVTRAWFVAPFAAIDVAYIAAAQEHEEKSESEGLEATITVYIF